MFVEKIKFYYAKILEILLYWDNKNLHFKNWEKLLAHDTLTFKHNYKTRLHSEAGRAKFFQLLQ